MVKTLAELIAETQEKFPGAVQKAIETAEAKFPTRTGDFSTLRPGLQVGIAESVAVKGREIRNVFRITPGVPGVRAGTKSFTEGSAIDVQNLFRLGESTIQRAKENQNTNDRVDDVQNQVNQINDRVSTQLTNLGMSITDASKAAAAAQGKNNFFDAFAGIPQIALIGGAALLAIVLLKR